jgi:hypothetical protein
MPSAEHESPIALAKLDPGVLTWLLANVFGVKVPDYHHARTGSGQPGTRGTVGDLQWRPR